MRNRFEWFSGWMCFVLLFAASPACAENYPTVVEATERAVLSAEWEGVLTDFRINVGDSVKKGSTVGVVFHKDLVIARMKHEANRKYLAERIENLKKLNEKGMVPDEELAKAKMEKEVSDAEISLINTQIGKARIAAPFSGIAVARHIQPHEWVKAGQPVVEIYDPQKLRIVADIPAEVAVGLKSGQKDSFFFSDLNMDAIGVLDVVFPQVDVRSNTVKVYWTVSAESLKTVRLVPGMKGVLKLGNQ